MGRSGENVERLSERRIQEAIYQQGFLSHSSIKYYAENMFIYEWESDIWLMTKSGYAYEVEIKITRSDFKNDFKNKADKHVILESGASSDQDNRLRPNYFYYAVPNSLISPEDIPEYAGLLYVTVVPTALNKNGYYRLDVVKAAPKIHKDKTDVEFLRLTDKFYFNYIAWKNRYLNYKRDTDSLLEECRTFDGTVYGMSLPTAISMNELLQNEVNELREDNDRLRKALTEEHMDAMTIIREKERIIKNLQKHDAL